MKGQKFPRKVSDIVMPLDEWPERDRLLYSLCLQEDGLFIKGGKGAKWAPATRTKYIGNYGRWLAWLKKTHPDMLKREPGHRISQAVIEDYRRYLASTLRPHSVASLLSGLGSMLWALCDTDKFAWVQCAAQRLARRAIGKDKRAILREPHELAEFGFQLMADADAGVRPGRYPPAVNYRNGLIIALLAYWPIRRRNLASIELGQHLIDAGDGYRIEFGAHETKQKRDISFLLPPALNIALKRYLTVHRPVLLQLGPHQGKAGNALWVGGDGDRLNGAGICRAVKLCTQSKFGKALSPHRFRDCAATGIATMDPSHVNDITAVLGHASLRCSERHYNQAGSIEAAQSYHQALRKLRRPLPDADRPQGRRGDLYGDDR